MHIATSFHFYLTGHGLKNESVATTATTLIILGSLVVLTEVKKSYFAQEEQQSGNGTRRVQKSITAKQWQQPQK